MQTQMQLSTSCIEERIVPLHKKSDFIYFIKLGTITYRILKKIILKYTDSWSYGGSCDFNIIIPAKYFDNEEFNDLENKLKTEQMTFLNKEIENSVKKIKDIQKYIEKTKLKLKTLSEKD